MYKYKRGINNIEQARIIEYTLTDNKNTCLSMSGNLDIRKPYSGMYIQNSKVMLLGLIEKIELKDKEYNMTQITTSLKNISCDEYITSIDLENNLFEYNVGTLSYKKRLKLSDKILCIEYEISNKENSQAKFKVIPMVTYRDLYTMKTSNFMKFNQRDDRDGVVVNLSIIDQVNIIIKSDELKWTREPSYLNNVKHEYIDTTSIKQLYSEDIFVPGEFEIVLKPFEDKKVSVYVSSLELDAKELAQGEMFKNTKLRKEKIEADIREEFVELRELAKTIDNLNMEEALISKLPYQNDYNILFKDIESVRDSKNITEYIDELTNIVKSVDGQYLTFNKSKEAIKVLVIIRRYINIIDDLKFNDIEVIKKFLKLKLWYIEAIHRLLQKNNIVDLFFDFTKETIYNLFENKEKENILIDIEMVSLVYNSIKIYENMLISKREQDLVVDKFKDEIKELIENKFWCEDKRIMRKNISDIDAYANIEMIYTISLSYPCIVGDKPIKILDTVFKELYTPYGLREVSKNNSNSTGCIYPKYMAHFVKANLRQNGVTRASQKIAYNLVKELIQDISKHVNGGIKEIYSEKGINIDTSAYDLLTNAEIIRLYDMLT